MNYTPVIDQLSKEIETLTAARDVLLSLAGQPVTAPKKAPTKSTITPAGRKKLADMMRARWAERKRAQRAKKVKSPKASAKV